MNPLNELFSPFSECLVLNLDKDEDKLGRMRDRLGREGIAFTRVQAVHGKSLTPEERRRFSSVLGTYLLPSSVIGCFTTHRKAWQTVVDRGLATCLILEDDAEPVADFSRLVRRWWPEVPPDWELVMLGNFANTHDTPRWHEFLHEALNTGPRSKRVSEHVYRPSLIMGTHAYVVSCEGARKLLELLPVADGHVDMRMGAQLRHLNAYGMRPALAFQSDMGSSNIAGSAPVFLNRLATRAVVTEAPLQLSLGWLLSEPLCKLYSDDLLVNGWTAVFVLLGVVDLRLALCVVFLDVLGSLSVTPQVFSCREIGGYVTLLLGVATGAALRHGWACKKLT